MYNVHPHMHHVHIHTYVCVCGVCVRLCVCVCVCVYIYIYVYIYRERACISLSLSLSLSLYALCIHIIHTHTAAGFRRCSVTTWRSFCHGHLSLPTSPHSARTHGQSRAAKSDDFTAHRVAANDMPLPSPEIEFFCTCIHTIYNPGNSELKFFSRLNCKVPGISANEYPPLLSLSLSLSL